MFLSIIIPVYNTGNYISKCIESLITQSSSNFEVILINDGSTDNSYDICKEYANKDMRIKLFNQENQGVSAARNYGIKQAIGEYITFIDSDDWISRDYVKVINDEIGNNDLMFFQSSHVYSNGFVASFVAPVGIYNTSKSVQKMLDKLLVNNLSYEFFGYTWNKVFKKEIIDKFNIYFKEGLSLKEDELFTLQYCTFIKDMKIISNSIYNYRILDSGLTSAKKKSSDYYLLYKESKLWIKQFSEKSFLSTLYSRNLKFLYLAFTNEKHLVKQYLYFKELREYIRNCEYYTNPNLFFLGKRMSEIFRLPSYIGYIIYRLYNFLMHR